VLYFLLGNIVSAKAGVIYEEIKGGLFMKKYCLLFILMLGSSSLLFGLTKEEADKIREKYLAKESVRESSSMSMAGDLASGQKSVRESSSTSMAGDLATPELKKEVAQTGKKLQSQSDKIGLEDLEKEINTQQDKKELKEIEDDVKKVEKDPETAAAEAPGFWASLFNFPKLWYRVNSFNKVAAANIKRFSTTFNNVGIALASLDEDYKEAKHYIVMPKKNKNGTYVTGSNKLIAWEKVPAKEVTNAMIERLKLECQYIIIKEMVDGFKHLQPVIEPVLDVFSYLAPKLANQSRLIYEVGSQFLPMLETLAKDNLTTVLEDYKK